MDMDLFLSDRYLIIWWSAEKRWWPHGNTKIEPRMSTACVATRPKSAMKKHGVSCRDATFLSLGSLNNGSKMTNADEGPTNVPQMGAKMRIKWNSVEDSADVLCPLDPYKKFPPYFGTNTSLCPNSVPFERNDCHFGSFQDWIKFIKTETWWR